MAKKPVKAGPEHKEQLESMGLPVQELEQRGFTLDQILQFFQQIAQLIVQFLPPKGK